MTDLFDKTIHGSEFRLRILVTNGCNKNCTFCLNDFQDKPKDPSRPRLLDRGIAKEVIDAYATFMSSKGLTPIVTFSGGEPGIHPRLADLVIVAKAHDCVTKVATNGTALHVPGLIEVTDCWHVAVTGIDYDLINTIATYKKRYYIGDVHVQFVVTKKTVDYIMNIADFYVGEGIPVKFFVDFFSVGSDRIWIEHNIETVAATNPEMISSSFTGIQENRGIACAGCKKQCVTLKALWLFPDGGVSVCPQGESSVYYVTQSTSWPEVVETAFEVHAVKW